LREYLAEEIGSFMEMLEFGWLLLRRTVRRCPYGAGDMLGLITVRFNDPSFYVVAPAEKQRVSVYIW
jgi:hypothetical protein